MIAQHEAFKTPQSDPPRRKSLNFDRNSVQNGCIEEKLTWPPEAYFLH